MAFRNQDETEYEGLQAVPAMAMAMFEQTGLRSLLDSRISSDIRQKLTAGNAVKAMVGTMASAEGRRALFNIADMYRMAPNDRLFGPKVDTRALNARAFSRCLDTLYEENLGKLLNECYHRLCSEYSLSSDVFNVDMTNFGITALTKEPDIEDAAIPERCGHAKDGHDERLVYSLLSITDGNGIVCYERPYNGSTADSEMDLGAIEFLSGNAEPDKSTIIADCKIVTAPLIDLMNSRGFGFVSKCPDNFGRKAKKRVIDSIEDGAMVPSSVRDGWELFDTDADVEGKMMRFVAFRTTDDIDAGIRYLRDQGLKESNALFGRFESLRFNCEEDARRAITAAVTENKDSAYIPEWALEEVEISLGYGHRGRPRKNEVPQTKTEYRVSVDLRFDEERAKALSIDRGIRVLITNLPRSDKDADSIRFGATADTVLKMYLGQYRIEHAFRLMKYGMGIDRVYLHRPSRENAMIFVISVATMLSDCACAVLKREGIDTTLERLSGRYSSMMLLFDRVSGDIIPKGSKAQIDEFLRCVETLHLDPDNLFRCRFGNKIRYFERRLSSFEE